jgi:DNA-binding transcriptional MerR regulator
MSDKSAEAFRTISEVAGELGVAQHVLRFWETRFAAVKPMKRGGNRRYYRPDDVQLLRAINKLLYSDGYTIKGVQKLLRDKGAKGVIAHVMDALASPAAAAAAAPAAIGAAAAVRAAPADLFDAPARPAAVNDALVVSLRAIRDRLAGAVSEARAA